MHGFSLKISAFALFKYISRDIIYICFFIVFIIAFCCLINPLLALKEIYFILVQVILKVS